jgi:aspartyl protease family protein
VRRGLMWILLFVLASGLLVLITRGGEQTLVGLTPNDFSALVVRVALAVFIGAMVLALFRERWSCALESALVWVAVALLLVLGYTYRFELRDVRDRVLAELIPGHVAARGNSVEIARGRAGEFGISADVNGAPVAMVLDTGASAVVLTFEAAEAAGLPVEVLTYTVSVDTANGRTRAAPVTLDRLAVGNIVERAVPALIAQHGQLRTSLLGMSFLNRLESWQVRGEKLILRGYP